jgi:hypothetical protein
MYSITTYKRKYLKYKNKYIKLKKYIGGANETEIKVLINLNGIKELPFSLKVLPTDTILNLKEKIEVNKGYPISKQKKVSTVKNGTLLINLEDSDSVLGHPIILLDIITLEECILCSNYIENKDLFTISEKKYIHRLKCLFKFISARLRLEVLLDNKGVLPYDFTDGFLTIDDVKKIKVLNDEEQTTKDEIVKKWSTLIESIGSDKISKEDYWKNIRDLKKKEFLKKFKEQVEKKDIINLANLIYFEYLLNHCPRCNQYYSGHTSCNALTCPNCHAGFCAICLKDCGEDAHIHIKEHGAALFDKEQVAYGLKERAAKKLLDMVIFLQQTPETEQLIDPLFSQLKKTLDEIGITKHYILAMAESKKRLSKK